ncbi:hypothetical protein HIM_00983 [Hirsutella minnesotensis 3608]|nr:hypothetical protein HIM_00983 [Hirsutella minnesotensis 3608]
MLLNEQVNLSARPRSQQSLDQLDAPRCAADDLEPESNEYDGDHIQDFTIDWPTSSIDELFFGECEAHFEDSMEDGKIQIGNAVVASTPRQASA